MTHCYNEVDRQNAETLAASTLLAAAAIDASGDPADTRPGSRVGAGHVRPGDVLDITYRVTVTAVGDECDIETDDRQRKHNLHASNATAHLVHR